MTLSAIAPGLENRDGIWYTKSKSKISYPAVGNSECYQIEDTSFWFKHRNNCLTSLIKRFPPAGIIFDIGGANGYQAQSLIKAGFDVVLVEPGEQAIQNAQRRGLKELICATLDDAKFYPNTMPAIGLFDVVEHIADETGFLQTVQNILQPGGRLYLTVPVYQWLWSDEDVRAGHFRRYTIKSLSQALRRAGLEMEYCSYFFSILPLPIYFTRTVPSYFRMAKTITTTKTSPSSTTQHRQRPGMVGRLAEMFFRSEHKRIAQGRHIPFGSSCLAVAKKVSVGV